MGEEVTLAQVVEEVQVLRLQPGDVIILKSPSIMRGGDFRAILHAQEQITKHVGFKVMILALPDDANLSMMSKALLENPAFDGPRPVADVPAGDPPPPKPLPMPPPGNNAFHVLKSRKPGPLSGIIDSAKEPPGELVNGPLVPGSNCGDCGHNPCDCPP